MTLRPDDAEATTYFAAVACYCGGYSACAHKMATATEAAEAEALARAAWNRRAALAEPVAAAVAEPVAWDWLRGVIDGIPTREEYIGGQREKYVSKEAVMGWLHEGQSRAMRAAPPQREPKAGLLDQFLALAEANGIKSIRDLPGLIPALQATQTPRRQRGPECDYPTCSAACGAVERYCQKALGETPDAPASAPKEQP